MKSPGRAYPVSRLLVGIALLLLAAGMSGGLIASPASAGDVISPAFESVIAGDGDGMDAATGVSLGADGAVFTSGYLWHEATGDDITVSRAGGAQAGWTRMWNGPDPSYDRASDIVTSPDGSVYVCGYRQGADGTKPILLKYSGAGALLWEAVPGDSPSMYSGGAVRLGLDAAGNVYVCCWDHSGDEGLARVFVAKYLPEGTPSWVTDYRVNGYYKIETFARDFLVEPGGRCYVVGDASGVDFGNGDEGPKAFALCLRADGARRWARVYSGPGGKTALFSALAPCPSGGIYAAGWASSARWRDALVVRYRADGTRALTRRLGAGDRLDQSARDVAVDASGRIAVSGSWPRGDGGFYVAVLRWDGSVKWSHDYARATRADRLVVGAGGLVYAAGTAPDGVIAAFAFARDGVLQWSSAWPSSPAPGVDPYLPSLLDMQASESGVWVTGGTALRPATGSDQFVLGWPLIR